MNIKGAKAEKKCSMSFLVVESGGGDIRYQKCKGKRVRIMFCWVEVNCGYRYQGAHPTRLAQSELQTYPLLLTPVIEASI